MRITPEEYMYFLRLSLSCLVEPCQGRTQPRGRLRGSCLQQRSTRHAIQAHLIALDQRRGPKERCVPAGPRTAWGAHMA